MILHICHVTPFCLAIVQFTFTVYCVNSLRQLGCYICMSTVIIIVYNNIVLLSGMEIPFLYLYSGD